MNWRNLRNNIPNRIRTKAKIYFDVLWQDNLIDKGGKSCFGITNFEPNQIVLDTKQSDKEATLTFFHEALHAFSDAYEIGLTEKQVRKLEKAFPYIKKVFDELEGKK